MRETDGLHHDPLALQALLYAGGELPAADADAFERLLANDQAAREALVQAVQLAQPLRGRPSAPDPAYRDRVRRRLRPGPGLWRLLVGRRTYRGHPLLWSAVGAAAAVLLVAFLPRAQPDVVVVRAEPPSEEAPTFSEPLALPDDDPDAFDVARVWAETPKGGHLERAREDEMKRKVRAEDRGRPARPEERRDRPLSNTNPRH
jgi:hypothetical protein